MKKRIVVTGLGIVSPLGNDLSANWDAVLNGKSGIGIISRFNTEGWPTRIAGEVRDFNYSKYVDPKEARRFDRVHLFAVAAGAMAMEAANLSVGDYDPFRAGADIGSGIGGFESICSTYADFLKGGIRKVSPFFIPGAIINMASGLLSIRYQLKGPNLSVVTACATGTHAIGDSAKLIERGDADVMLAGGTESPLTEVAVAGFANMKALSRRNDEPERASRPFDKDRDGFVMGEGAGVLVLESLEHALKRNAVILAEVSGYGLTGDAYHITAPDETASGARRAMEMALKDAGIAPEEVGYINAHGTSTPYNDRLETLAIKDLFKQHAKKLFISSTKSMTGHTLGAAGAIEAIYSIMALKNGIIPPTINLDNPDPECDLNYVPHKPVKADIKYALSNSFGFGGTNGCVLFKKYEG
ncbi:MAG: beta-ketoacyl-ACP synthase II [Deferribacteraceae bacterium]|jgi:3-oxoacyl-[acyl-carrier-protein] synthase II|nr:beta-ketoacyl-ACP synthase II [Deferribacteraceae bacterium]